MERLTKSDLNKVCYSPWELCGMDQYCSKGIYDEGGCTNGCNILKMYKKLAEYEDLEEQGLLLRMPCKVGDKVYAFCEEFGILEYGVYGIILFQDKIIFQCSSFSGYCNDDTPECLDEIEPYISDFGKTVFLSREEAERKLKELQKEGVIHEQIS